MKEEILEMLGRKVNYPSIQIYETASEGLHFLFMVQLPNLEISYQINFKSDSKQYWAQIII